MDVKTRGGGHASRARSRSRHAWAREKFDAEPSSLRSAARDLADPTATLKRAASTLDGARLPAQLLGDVPSAATLSSTVERMVEDAADSARTASGATERLADALEASSHHYQVTDQNVQRLLDRLNPW